MDKAMLAPDQATLEADLRLPEFVAGVEEQRWKVLEISFPDLFVRVTGRAFESDRTEIWEFHLKCDNYPEIGPFVERWDHTKRCRPPRPERGSPGFLDALKDWDEGGAHGGIYRAWQRMAAAHNGWATKRPDEAWNRQRKITYIMEHLHALVAEQACALDRR
jgi:hypothetical protein